MSTLKKRSFPIHKYGRFPGERDEATERWWGELWKSWSILVPIGLTLIVFGLLLAVFMGTIIVFMRTATFYVDGKLTPYEVMTNVGAIFLAIGLYNYLMRKWHRRYR